MCSSAMLSAAYYSIAPSLSLAGNELFWQFAHGTSVARLVPFPSLPILPSLCRHWPDARRLRCALPSRFRGRRHSSTWQGRPYWTRSAFRTARPISPRTAHHLSSSIPPAPSLDRRLSIGQAHRPRKSQASLVLAHPCSHQSALTHTALTPVGSRAHCAHARLSRTAFAPCQFWRTSAS